MRLYQRRQAGRGTVAQAGGGETCDVEEEEQMEEVEGGSDEDVQKKKGDGRLVMRLRVQLIHLTI